MTKNNRKKRFSSDDKIIQLALEFPPVINPILLSVTEIFDSASESLLENLKEDKRIERKPVGIHAKELGDYIVMYANTATQGGIIVVGQENTGTFSGCLKADINHINELDKAGDIYCPDARYVTKRVNVRLADGTDDYVLLFRVSFRENKVVRNTRKDVFVRSGDTKKKISEEEARELEIERGQIDFEQESSGLDYPNDFDTELIKEFVNSYKESRQLEEKHTSEDILSLLTI